MARNLALLGASGGLFISRGLLLLFLFHLSLSSLPLEVSPPPHFTPKPAILFFTFYPFFPGLQAHILLSFSSLPPFITLFMFLFLLTFSLSVPCHPTSQLFFPSPSLPRSHFPPSCPFLPLYLNPSHPP
jgi:hypothetical protein